MNLDPTKKTPLLSQLKTEVSGYGTYYIIGLSYERPYLVLALNLIMIS